jgi:CheY-like chemotaxis protein
VRANIRQRLLATGHYPLEAVNLEHAGHILSQLNSDLDLILACSQSERETDHIRQWHAEHNHVPLVVMPLEPDSVGNLSSDDLAIRVRVALSGAPAATSVIVVAEDASERNLLSSVLESAGYWVRQASNGHEALNLCRSDVPDILLTDVVMPDKDGLELIQQLRAECPQTAVFAMSGGPRAQSYLSMARRFGANGTFAKPLSTEDVLQRFRDVRNPSPRAN